jgi:hypothetical protein
MSLLVVALVLFLVFGGLGFVAHVLWLGLLIAAGVAVVHMITGKKHAHS